MHSSFLLTILLTLLQLPTPTLTYLSWLDIPNLCTEQQQLQATPAPMTSAHGLLSFTVFPSFTITLLTKAAVMLSGFRQENNNDVRFHTEYAISAMSVDISLTLFSPSSFGYLNYFVLFVGASNDNYFWITSSCNPSTNLTTSSRLETYTIHTPTDKTLFTGIKHERAAYLLSFKGTYNSDKYELYVSATSLDITNNNLIVKWYMGAGTATTEICMTTLFLNISYPWIEESRPIWYYAVTSSAFYVDASTQMNMLSLEAAYMMMDAAFLPWTKTRCFFGINIWKDQGTTGIFEKSITVDIMLFIGSTETVQNVYHVIGFLSFCIVEGTCDPRGEYFDFATQACLACSLPNCATCPNDVCTLCIAPFMLHMMTLTCVSCTLPNCATCSSPTVCATCTPPYINDPVLGCQLCTLAHCTTCTSLTVCQTCTPPYLNDPVLGCQLCTIVNCVSCTTLAVCGSCDPGFYVTTSSTCGSCAVLAGCVDCTDATHCVTCAPGYGLATDSTCQSCSTAMPNCIQCTTPAICTQCTNTSYFINTGSSCSSCQSSIPYCLSCTSSISCSTCVTEYYLASPTSCLKCSNARAGCLTCLTASICTGCTNNNYFLSAGTCKLCYSTMANCLECTSGTNCTRCAIGFYIVDGGCWRCGDVMLGCAMCENATVCEYSMYASTTPTNSSTTSRNTTTTNTTTNTTTTTDNTTTPTSQNLTQQQYTKLLTIGISIIVLLALLIIVAIVFIVCVTVSSRSAPLAPAAVLGESGGYVEAPKLSANSNINNNNTHRNTYNGLTEFSSQLRLQNHQELTIGQNHDPSPKKKKKRAKPKIIQDKTVISNSMNNLMNIMNGNQNVDIDGDGNVNSNGNGSSLSYYGNENDHINGNGINNGHDDKDVNKIVKENSNRMSHVNSNMHVINKNQAKQFDDIEFQIEIDN